MLSNATFVLTPAMNEPVDFLSKKSKLKLDWESIRSSPRDGSNTSTGLTKGWLGFGGWFVVVGWVVVFLADK